MRLIFDIKINEKSTKMYNSALSFNIKENEKIIPDPPLYQDL